MDSHDSGEETMIKKLTATQLLNLQRNKAKKRLKRFNQGIAQLPAEKRDELYQAYYAYLEIPTNKMGKEQGKKILAENGIHIPPEVSVTEAGASSAKKALAAWHPKLERRIPAALLAFLIVSSFI